MKFLRCVCILVLATTAACAAPPSTARPPLTARVDVQDDPAHHTLTFEVLADAPLSSARLLIGASDVPSAVDVPAAAQAPSYTLRVPDSGLRLPHGLDTLRYAWLLRSVSGETLTLSQSVRSPQLVQDDAAPTLEWKEAHAGNLTVRYLPDSPAARDLDAVERTSADALQRSSVALNWSSSKPVTIYLLPRVFWQGGATFDRTILISYADRAYTGVSLLDYVAHEGAHVLTGEWGNLGAAGGMLAEGVAVYATGGHYQPDTLDQSAATLVQSPLFIPPAILRRDFANQQHEIAYTESGSFVRYLIDRYGLDDFRALMRRPNDWSNIYGQDFAALTQDWLSLLHARTTSADELRRWQLKIRFYNLLRLYEERFDAGARKLPGPDPTKWDAAMRTAMSEPSDSEENRVLELMLVSAIEAIEDERSAQQLDSGEAYLSDVERIVRSPDAPDDTLMGEVRNIVKVVGREDQALLDRDWGALLSALDAAGAPDFSAQVLREAPAQPAWLRYTQMPTHLTLAGDHAWLTVAQWTEPLDATQSNPDNGQRWVLALVKQAGQWRVAGRFPESPGALTAR